MITAERLREIFAEKLKETNSLDQAFVKATWVAYKQGIYDATPEDQRANLLRRADDYKDITT